MIEEIFKLYNLKCTNKRKKIYKYLMNDKAICKKRDIISTFENNMDKVTIYRILNQFLSKNMIKENILDGEIFYEIVPFNHEHYIKCINCNKKQIIPEEKIEKFEKSVLGGKEILSHQIEFYIMCEKCKVEKNI